MTKILEMRAKRAKLWDACKAFLDARRAADGTLAAEDKATYDRMEDEVIDLGKEIERLERQAAIDAEMNLPVNRAITTRPDATVEADKPAKKGLASDEYRENFWRAMRAKSVPHEVYNALTIGTDSEGGYLVPDEYQRTLPPATGRFPSWRAMAPPPGSTRAASIPRATMPSARYPSALTSWRP